MNLTLGLYPKHHEISLQELKAQMEKLIEPEGSPKGKGQKGGREDRSTPPAGGKTSRRCPGHEERADPRSGLQVRAPHPEGSRRECVYSPWPPETLSPRQAHPSGEMLRKVCQRGFPGALPGISVTMIQKFPSYVFQIDQSQFAIDQQMAETIYVRLEKGAGK